MGSRRSLVLIDGQYFELHVYDVIMYDPYSGEITRRV